MNFLATDLVFNCCMFGIKEKAFSSSYNHPFTIQDGWTALKQASFKGHHKVVELLLGAGANPDLQDKVRTGWDSGVHSNLSNMKMHFMHPVILRAHNNLFSMLVCLLS